MGLKQIQDADRILFLREFVQELVINSVKDEQLKNLIKAEKIKRKYIEPNGSGSFEKAEGSFIFKPKGYEKSISFGEQRLSEEKGVKTKQVFHRTKVPIQQQVPVQQKTLVQPGQEFMQEGIGSKDVSKTSDLGFKKLEHLIKDSAIQMIECPGPGKNILVRVRNRLNTTKTVLNESEIKDVINYFSKQAMIPVVGGILKAAVGDLVISAVVSEFVGSRFIINKKSPYSLIEGAV